MSAVTPENTVSAIETFSGRYVDTLVPHLEGIDLGDIAHHLATINRFSGAARRPISVAEHALLVADRLCRNGHDRATSLAGLHHDDAEAYLGDVTRPLKRKLGEVYVDAEQRMLRAIWTALRLPSMEAVDWAAVKAADDWALAAEAYHLLPSRGAGWRDAAAYDPDADLFATERLRQDYESPWQLIRDHWLLAHEHLARSLA